jgi:hypothetical protein
MTDLPEKIWAYAGSFKMWRGHKTDRGQRQTEYTRTDVTEARIKELEAALAWYKEQVYFFANGTTVRANEAAIVLEEDGGKKARTDLKGEKT